MKKLKILGVFVLTVSLQIKFILAQDIHHSQFYTSPLNMNPALTGTFNGDWRAAGNYRSQWFVDNLVNYLTFTGSYDIRFYPKKWTTKGLWSAGFLFNYDRAGDSKLSLGYLGISASYAYPINKNNILSIGGLIGGAQRRFQQDQLTWDEQWNGSSFDPNLSSQENFDRTSNGFLDLAAGINYRWQKSARTKIDCGIGLFHLNKPDQQFFSQTESVKLPMRLNLNLMPNFKVLDRLDILLHAQFQRQQNYQEILFGGYGKFYLSLKRGKEFSLLLGVSARTKDAVIPKLAFQFNNWYGGLSYDINTSPFDLATRGRGGPEFSLIYTYVKSRPLSQLKACPIF
ncbi:MAG: PorP/SprF family type IX secretion system membrane protein [Saprospiraceae bacterium]|nr:PorP/SprF family type IX secretion system membrane protein [Candidatus Vicinibacter affinis]